MLGVADLTVHGYSDALNVGRQLEGSSWKIRIVLRCTNSLVQPNFPPAASTSSFEVYDWPQSLLVEEDTPFGGKAARE